MKFAISKITYKKISTIATGRIQFWVSVLIAASVLCFLVFYRTQLIAALFRVHIRWIMAGLFCYGFNYILRAYRLHILSGRRITLWPNAIYASSLHGFVTYLMPLQIGDLSLPVILKNFDGIELSDGGAILIRTRLLDIFSLGSLIFTAAMLSDINLGMSLRLIWILIGGMMAITPFIIRRLMTGNWLQTKRFGHLLKPFAEAGRFSIYELLISLWIWTAITSVFFCVARAINLPISFGGIWLLLTIQLPLQMLPIQGLANTGNHEGAWIVTLSLLGIPVSTAAEFAFTSHIIILFYVLVLGTVPLFTGSKKQPD
jgi:hypothetical protein